MRLFDFCFKFSDIRDLQTMKEVSNDVVQRRGSDDIHPNVDGRAGVHLVYLLTLLRLSPFDAG